MFLLMKQEKNFVWKSWRWCYLNETRNSVFSRGLWCFVRYIQAGGKPKIRQVSWAIWWALTFYDGLTHHWSFGHFHLINIFPQLLRLFRGHSLWKWLKKSHFTTFLKAIWRLFLTLLQVFINGVHPSLSLPLKSMTLIEFLANIF